MHVERSEKKRRLRSRRRRKRGRSQSKVNSKEKVLARSRRKRAAKYFDGAAKEYNLKEKGVRPEKISKRGRINLERKVLRIEAGVYGPPGK